ncbi:hypothetical protein PybrP1_001802, partial [[Pythium] brassicae (nom. inval.)]
NYITKVTYLVAVARPRFDDDGAMLFDGKVGNWPVVETTSAKCTSKYSGGDRSTLQGDPADEIASCDQGEMAGFVLSCLLHYRILLFGVSVFFH